METDREASRAESAQAVVEMFRQQAPEYGWRVWKCVPFSCLSVFLISAIDKAIIHIDHYLIHANTADDFTHLPID